ncbi:hypothetical protein PMAYCL1PPCAC_21043 [Pristionchus mayeri]|uniref:Uncharacterized protein n=1 Tax=Pristionchus mayeri TaxID=1317129 RepID=A0AAN5I3P0_9BILA|nr:hypothetical protein PMAYCL1PPCAC_21043 [Pristionchus mayeri]
MLRCLSGTHRKAISRRPRVRAVSTRTSRSRASAITVTTPAAIIAAIISAITAISGIAYMAAFVRELDVPFHTIDAFSIHCLYDVLGFTLALILNEDKSGRLQQTSKAANESILNLIKLHRGKHKPHQRIRQSDCIVLNIPYFFLIPADVSFLRVVHM